MPKKSASRPHAVYRATFGVTLEERLILEATAQLLKMGIGELLWSWVRPLVEHYAQNPEVQDWVLAKEMGAPEPLIKRELTKEEALGVIEGKEGPEWL